MNMLFVYIYMYVQLQTQDISMCRLYKTDMVKYNECAKEWTKKYAM